MNLNYCRLDEHSKDGAMLYVQRSENLMNLNELGGKHIFVVIKIEDLIKYVKSPFKLAMLDNDLKDIRKGREADGKKSDNEYLVINLDESYAPEIIEIMKRNGHWDL